MNVLKTSTKAAGLLDNVPPWDALGLLRQVAQDQQSVKVGQLSFIFFFLCHLLKGYGIDSGTIVCCRCARTLGKTRWLILIEDE